MSCRRPGFPRGTTPLLTFTVTGYDLTQWDVLRAARYNGTEAIATDIVPLDVKRILLDGEIGVPEVPDDENPA